MDIDDILAELDSDPTPQETRDLQDLTRAWVAERAAPELLPWPESLMERMTDRIRRQVNHLTNGQNLDYAFKTKPRLEIS